MNRNVAWVLLLVGLIALPGGAGSLWAQDDDGDGLSAEQEAILGTDPARADTDGDGLLDGDEYFLYFTNPLEEDTDRDGIPDGEDRYPFELFYRDLNGITTTVDRIVAGPEGLRLRQLVEIKVGNVITVDWTNVLQEDFTLQEAEFLIRFDFLDPTREDFVGEGYYRPRKGENGESLMEIRLPSYEGIFEAVIPWPGNAMTISDWVYRFYDRPLEVGQRWAFNVFYHELLRWGEDPFFSVTAEVVAEVSMPLDTRLGRREYPAYEIRAVFRHAPFQDPFFRTQLGENPELVLQAFLTRGEGARAPVVLRYTTLFFRVTPTKSVGFSVFQVQR